MWKLVGRPFRLIDANEEACGQARASECDLRGHMYSRDWLEVHLEVSGSPSCSGFRYTVAPFSAVCLDFAGFCRGFCYGLAVDFSGVILSVLPLQGLSAPKNPQKIHTEFVTKSTLSE